ncbi:hypothetical protein B0T22DRAFT_428191 [Podospora appendiculata]|uniref:Complex I intermediate-associated protein 84, mitochondrial n=1 Tax=Podospora appendiculata TaxID=314037 RepID=A0AAE1C9V9_9PEZI|nr:hypothetical protein B0T22DRAFT_428191 [Podospora appendiculata]
MRSHLTRNVYRRLLAGHGLVRPCPGPGPGPALAPSSARCLTIRHAHGRQPMQQLLVRRPSRRSFIGIFQKPPRELKEPELEPGYNALLLFRSMESDDARPPSRESLLLGLRQLLRHKKRFHKVMNTTQAFLTLRLLRYLLENPSEDVGDDLDLDDMRLALEIVLKPPKGDDEHHLELSKLLFEEIGRRVRSSPDLDMGLEPAQASEINNDFRMYITGLTQYGASMEAAEAVAEHWRELQDANGIYAEAKALWILVLRGLAKEGREAELLRVYQEYGKAAGPGLDYTPPVHEIMTTYFASRDRVSETKHWFRKRIHAKELPTPESYLEIVRFAMRNDEKDWIQPFFETLVNSNPPKPYWDAVFQWAVLAMDQGVEDIKQIITTMLRHNEGNDDIKPDARTIDVLIMASIEKKNPYLAERFLALGPELGIAPKSTTYILQMDYRLDAKDFSGAQAIYQKLQNGEVEVWNDEDLPVLNKYIRALCTVAEPDIERILDITGELEQRHAILEPETVVSLCMVFLRSDKQFDVIDTLSLHTVSYSLEEREKVRKGFVQYILDRKVSTARVWDAYTLLRQFFPETDPEDRILLMDSFFDRKRPDMACQIFGHMRAHANPAQRPTADLYVRCLEGIGRRPDADSLQMIHNMLKMDVTIQLNTRLCNALMLAYAACDDPPAAMEFWSQIQNSAEGPSYNSLAIVFWVCELVPFGDRTAREVWQQMQRMDLDVPPFVFSAYCGAIAGQGHVEEVKRLIAGSEAALGYPPGVYTIGITYNALPGVERQELFEEWAKEEYPEIWVRLERKGRRETVAGRKFRLERTMQA